MQKITVEEAIYGENIIFIDARSPNEYAESTIPGAKNLPIFTDQERKEIGTLYHQDKDLAYEQGLKIGSSKLFSIYKYIKSLAIPKSCKVVVFCWRGGMRSKSIAMNLDMMGINAFQLKGGYKAYRRFILDYLETFQKSFQFYVLHGNTGVGKTNILKDLEEKGEPVLDLEGLANNRGSMFGAVGLGAPINQKMFDSLLFNKLKKNNKDYFFIESESRRVGSILLPEFLISDMEKGIHILVKADIQQRVKNIKKDYLPIKDKEEVISLINNNKFFEKKRGKQWVQNLLSLLSIDDYDNFIKTLFVDYYDPLYRHSEKKYNPYDFVICNDNIQSCTDKILSFTKKKA